MSELRIWKSRLDFWYEAHRNIGKKPKPPQREVAWVLLHAENSEAAVKAAMAWGDSSGYMSKGRKLLSIEHRQTGAVKLPLTVDSLLG